MDKVCGLQTAVKKKKNSGPHKEKRTAGLSKKKRGKKQTGLLLARFSTQRQKIRLQEGKKRTTIARLLHFSPPSPSAELRFFFGICKKKTTTSSPDSSGDLRSIHIKYITTPVSSWIAPAAPRAAGERVWESAVKTFALACLRYVRLSPSGTAECY